jgi:hypothetical protein
MKKKCNQIRSQLVESGSKDQPIPVVTRHLEQCSDCRDWMAELRKFRELWETGKVEMPSQDDITGARQNAMRRIRLGESGQPQSEGYRKQVSWKTAWGVALAVVVFAAGLYFGSLMRSIKPGTLKSAGEALPAWVLKAIKSPSADLPPGIDVASMGLPRILAFMIKNDHNEGHRLESVKELGNINDDQMARDALVYALRYDSNPGVRMRAIKALSESQINPTLRDAYIYALWHDTNAGVRLEAIEALAPVAQDKLVNEVLRFVAANDNQQGVRVQAREVMRMPRAG